MLLALNKPFGVLSQFTPDHPGQRTLSEFHFPSNVYPLGRLDRDSEGLLLLSDEPGLNTKLLDPKQAHPRTYWAQVEGQITEPALQKLREGVVIEGRKTLPAQAQQIHPEEPGGTGVCLGAISVPRSRDSGSPVTTRSPTLLIPPRNPPIRVRQNIPTSWLELTLQEGRNRQVRKMTAAVGHPTLRLLRVAIGHFHLPHDLTPGQWRKLTESDRTSIFAR
jgi:23S rRNA pseudouridine2457 synthase